MLAGFGLLGALSAKGVSRPFDVHRDGFVVGEGAAFFVLANVREGAAAQVAGVGRSLDAHHLTKPHPQGEGARRAMRTALQQAGLQTVDYVQAHGTSTLLNDAVEAAAVQDLVGSVPISSAKGALGHWVAGAGALGVLCAIEAVRSDQVPPTAGLRAAAADCPGDHVIGTGRPHTVHSALVNSFAFGGANSSIVVRAC
jgi:3-oxoacyl-[acyl-carrier-protein] synthase II